MLNKYTQKLYKKDIKECTNEEIYISILNLIKDLSKNIEKNTSKKKLYYISAEFLIGKLLSNNLINLGIFEKIKEELEKNGKNLSDIEELEVEPSLANGGLGRLAACFIDSLATLGINGDGIGINYHLGLFYQDIKNLEQNPLPNNWINEKSFLNKTETTFNIEFKNYNIKSRLYQIDVLGYNQNKKNTLNLFDVDTVDEKIVHNGIDFDKTDIEKNLTLFLYPDDSDKDGQLLRIYQQYFMVSSGAQFMIKEAIERGANYNNLDEYIRVQINDTHPSMVIPELIRLITKAGISFEKAVEITRNICAYTNHTILAEALEKWDISYLEEVCPEIMKIIYKLDEIVRNEYKDPNLYIIDSENRVHMAKMDIHFSSYINGVAKLHTDILINSELNDFYKIYPEKFNNKTNGITFRRWLIHSNNELYKYIVSLIGDEFIKDASKLEKLLDFVENKEVLEKLEEIKHNNKIKLKNHLRKKGIEINENSIIDTQIKRIHQYKRQQMNLLYVIYKYLEIKKGNIPKTPITILMAGKAAPAYILAQDIIHLALVLSELIKRDETVNKYLNIQFVGNYNVTEAEKLIPATDISEQISLASKEASGTGNMKFMLNGALTLGTLDGANVEIHDLVGDDNIFIFGKKSDEIIELYNTSGYISKNYYEKESIKYIVDFIISKELLEIGNRERLFRLYDDLINKDWFMTLIDLEEYIIKKEEVFNLYENRYEWNKKALINIAKVGFFSSDRTIEEYNKEIWKIYE